MMRRRDFRKSGTRAAGSAGRASSTGPVRHQNIQPQIVQIEKPVYGGAYLARLEGKAVFVPLTVPGEEVRVRITQSKSGYSTAEPEEIVHAAAERVAPRCRHFGVCGGCAYQHADYATQLEWKQMILRETLRRGGVEFLDEITVLAGEPWGYRSRIRLAVDAQGLVGYRGRRSHAVTAVEECPIAAPLLVKAGLEFAEEMRSLRAVELSLFCNADETELMVTVVAANPIAKEWDALGRRLRERIPVLAGVELVAESDPWRAVARWGASSLTYRAAGAEYRVDHGAFFQVNRFLVDALVERVVDGRKGRVAWDLFAGVGLFAKQLSHGFEHVVAVESAPMAAKALVENLGVGGEAMDADTLEFLRRTKKQKAGVVPELIVVDPPRAGLGAEVSSLLSEVSAAEVVYVSCDPATLTRDLKALLAGGYRIAGVTMADLFPQTFHLETVVHLSRA